MFPATFGRRLSAWLIDSLVIHATTFALITVLVNLLTPFGETALTGAIFLAAVVLLTLLSIIYFPLTMLRRGDHTGQTLGKQAMGIRVVRLDGERLTASTVLQRELLLKAIVFDKVALLMFIPWLANYLWPLWDRQGQALHDKLANTAVVDAASPRELSTRLTEPVYEELRERALVPRRPIV